MGNYVPIDKFRIWAMDNKWLCVEDDIYLTPNGSLVYITVVDNSVVDIKVTNDTSEF